jgi:hypothetical protein
MQQRIDAFETFKCEAIPQPRTPSRTLVLPPLDIDDMPPESTHRARYDAALTTTSPRGLRAILLIIMLFVLLAWAFSLYIAWRLP